MSEFVAMLAARAGIEDGYWDFFGGRHETSLETKRALLGAMRIAAETDGEARDSLERLERDVWGRVLRPVTVIDSRFVPAGINAILPARWDDAGVAYNVIAEDGKTWRGESRVRDLAWQGEGRHDGHLVHRRRVAMPDLPVGDYRVGLALPDGSSAEQSLVIAPGRAFSPSALEDGAGLWGIATQIYALRSADNWGMGDFTTLRRMGQIGAELGASAIGINPLHALFSARPDRYAPYAPSARCFLNVAYIDVTAIPEFAVCEEAQSRVAGVDFHRALAAARGNALVDYPLVATLKRDILERLYRCFVSARPGGSRGEAFHAFQIQGGQSARRFAIFEALQEHFLHRDVPLGYWRQWPQEFRDPDSAAVERFAHEHAARVDFFWWLQFVADEQSGAVQQACGDAGMPIGLYRDLGVGIADDGAEAWSQQSCLALSVSIGAPPDALAPQGQDWGLVPFDPLALQAQAYSPFRAVIAANMRHAGAMRLDHAMSLQRLYWVPRGLGAGQGAYVRYPVDDLMSLIALESQKQRCMVIGEDLGTVPEGFRDRMADRNLFAYRVLYFEKDGSEAFRPPQSYARQALSTIGTHDLPSLHGWWQGYDLDLRDRLGISVDTSILERARAGRPAERAALVAALANAGLLAEDFPVGASLDDARYAILMRAVHAFLNGAPSRLVMTQIEDVLGLVLQMNMPGTVNQHPNWRQRYAMDIETLAETPGLRDVALRLLADRDFRATGAKTER
jgi:4-alpha-glucanotransferase